MKKIAISAESTIDLPKDMLKKFEISTVPFGVFLGDDLIKDGDITIDEMFEFVKRTKILPKTSAVNEMEFQEHFEKLLENNDAVIHFSLSSKASLAYDNAKKAAEKMKNVYVVDSLSLSTGIALLALRAMDLIKEGKDVKTVYEECLKLREKMRVNFIIEKLTFLHKGGRCNLAQLMAASIFGIKPQITVKDGKMLLGSKFKERNMNKAVEKFTKNVIDAYSELDLNTAFITYTTATDEMINTIKTALENKGFKTIYAVRAGITIASHCGENTIGIIFLEQ